MSETKLSAKKRDLVGKKVKQLRKQGLIPANLYGKKIKSLSISLDKKEFEKVFEKVGETGIVNLAVEGEKETHSVMIPNLQKNPVSDEIIHVDLRQIILTEKITANIPVEIAGESPAAEQKLGILIQTISEIEVEALPLDLPEKFVADVSKLANVGDEVSVKELTFDKSKIELKVEEDLVLAKIEPLAEEEVAPVVEEAVEGAEVAEGEKEEGGESSDKEEGKEETDKEEKPKQEDKKE